MSLSEKLVVNVENFSSCVGCIRCAICLIITGTILQIVGFTGKHWSSSFDANHGLFVLCHNSTEFVCCDGFDAEWMTSVIVFQTAGLVSSSVTVVSAFLYTCASRTRGRYGTRLTVQVSSVSSALCIGVGASLYSSYYWNHHMLRDHHLSTSFTLVIIACVVFLVAFVIVTANSVMGYFEELPEECKIAQAPLLQQSSSRWSTQSQLKCILCNVNQRDVIFSCGHVKCCQSCAVDLQKGHYLCPTCKQPVTSCNSAYLWQPLYIITFNVDMITEWHTKCNL